MKKFFTFIFAAALAVSCWGTEVTIGGSSPSLSSDVPAKLTTSTSNSLSQQIYLKSEITGQGVSSGTITDIAFYHKGTCTNSCTRQFEVWIMEKSTSTLSTSYFDAISSSKRYPGTKCFDGSVTIPASEGWYTIHLSSTFVWVGSNNVIVTVFDKTNDEPDEEFKHKVFSATSRGKLTYNKSSYNINDIWNITGETKSMIPAIKFTFAGGATPTITVPSSVSLGTFDAQYEKDSTTFVVKGSDLKGDVTLSAAAGLEVFPTSITKEAIAAAGSTGVSVKVRSTNAYAFNSPKVTVSSQDATSQTVTINGTAAEYVAQISVQALYNTAVGSYSTLAGPTEIASVDASAQTFVIGSGSQACTIDYSSVPSTYVAHGKVSNLKVKKTDVGTFKAFAFDYAATGKTISETSENNPITYGTVTNVTLNRTLVADGYYSTICLPFAVTAEQIEEQFGAETVVQELVEASLSDNDMELTLNFEERDAIEAGKPYLIKPTKSGSSFTFNSVTLDNTDRSFTSTNLDFIGRFNQSILEVGVKNVLLLSGEDKLGWAEASGTFKGLRAYFKVKYHGSSAPSRLNARMVFNDVTEIQEIQNTSTRISDVHKFVYNGQLIIVREGQMYNAQGARL